MCVECRTNRDQLAEWQRMLSAATPFVASLFMCSPRPCTRRFSRDIPSPTSSLLAAACFLPFNDSRQCQCQKRVPRDSLFEFVYDQEEREREKWTKDEKDGCICHSINIIIAKTLEIRTISWRKLDANRGGLPTASVSWASIDEWCSRDHSGARLENRTFFTGNGLTL